MTTVQRRLISLSILLPSAAIAWTLGSWFQRSREQSSEARAAERKLFHCSSGVVAAGLERAGNTIALARRASEGLALDANASWHIEAPKALLGDADTIGALIEAACDLPSQGTTQAKDGEPALALDQFGLAPRRAALTLTYADGRTEALSVGDKSPYDGSLYVQRAPSPPKEPAGGAASVDGNQRSEHSEAPPAVERVDGGFAFQVERDLFALRSKRLVAGGAAELQAIDVAANGRPGFSLRREGEGFRLREAGPNASLLPADPRESRGLFEQLSSLAATRFVDEAPTAEVLPRFGLKQAAVEVVLHRANPNDANALSAEPIRLGLLQLGETNHLFAQVGSPNAPIAEVTADSLLQTLRQGAQKLRDMHLLSVDSEAVATLTIEANNKTLVLERTAAKDGVPAGWQVAGEPNGPASAIEPTRVRSLLFRLTNLRADTLGVQAAEPSELAAAGLTSPAYTVHLAGDDKRALGTLKVGAAAAERRPAQANDGPLGYIFAGALEGLSADAHDFAPVTAEGETSTTPAP